MADTYMTTDVKQPKHIDMVTGATFGQLAQTLPIQSGGWETWNEHVSESLFSLFSRSNFYKHLIINSLDIF